MHTTHIKSHQEQTETKGTLQAKNPENATAPKGMEGQSIDYATINPCWKKSIVVLYSTTTGVLGEERLGQAHRRGTVCGIFGSSRVFLVFYFSIMNIF
jgi:hypothetical protein